MLTEAGKPLSLPQLRSHEVKSVIVGPMRQNAPGVLCWGRGTQQKVGDNLSYMMRGVGGEGGAVHGTPKVRYLPTSAGSVRVDVSSVTSNVRQCTEAPCSSNPKPCAQNVRTAVEHVST